MQNRDTFSGFHPLILFLYFGMIFVFTMFFMHPVSLVISFFAALSYAVFLDGTKTVRFCLRLMLPAVLAAMVVNPAFHHEGATILCYLPTGNPLTLESILYGICSSVLLASVLLWFRCYSAVMTSDKFIYLFGRVIPSLSLVLSMTLRFIPKFQAQFRVVREAQSCIGRDLSSGSLLRRGKHAAAIFSIMLTWSLETAIETADSMKSRGYGLPGRTAFSIYRMDDRDRAVLAYLLFCGFYVACGWMAGGFAFRFYPTVGGFAVGALPVSFQLVYLALCLTPVILNQWEDRKWKHLKSGI